MRPAHKLALLTTVACGLAIPAPAVASDYSAGILADGPTLYWQLDETSGTTVDNTATADGSGDGTVAGLSVLGAAGAFPQSPHSATLQGASAIATTVQGRVGTVELWVKPTSGSSGAFLTYGNAFTLGYTAKRKLTLSVAGGAPKDTRVGLPLDRWTLVDVSFNTGGGADAKVFTNGGSWRVKTVRNVGATPTSTIGLVTLGGGIGGIDELATFPTSLSQAQAYLHYQRTALPIWTDRPTISGTPQSGQTLTAAPGTWSNATSTGFQWQRCDSADAATNACDDIPGATGATYLVQDADVGSYLSVTESSANANGLGSVDSVGVGPVTAPPVVDPGTGGGTGGTGGDAGAGTGGTGDTGDTGTTGTAPIAAAPTGTGSTGTGPTDTAGTTLPATVAPRCTARLLRVRPKKAAVRGAGRVTVKVAVAGPGTGKVVVKAGKATKKRLAKVAFKLDRKTLKGKGRRLDRSFKLARLKPGKHTLRITVRPRHRKPRTIKVGLTVRGC